MRTQNIHPPATITPLVKKRLVAITDTGQQAIESEVAEVREELEVTSQDYDTYRRRAINFGRHLIELRGRLREREDLLAAYEPPADLLERVSEQLQMIANLRFVERIQVRGEAVLVHTRPLFTDIRTGDGRRETKRRCIGAYVIRIQPQTPQDVEQGTSFANSAAVGGTRRRALVFDQVLYRPSDYPYQHWGIKNRIACFGDYRNAISTYYQSGDYYNLLITVYSFLTVADQDGSAWRKSHNWLREVRNEDGKLPPVGTEVELTVPGCRYDGAYFDQNERATIIAHKSSASGRVGIEVHADAIYRGLVPEECGYCSDEDEDAEGCYCDSCDYSLGAVPTDQVIGHDCDGHGEPGRCYWLPVDLVRVVDEQISLDGTTQTVTDPLAMLDQLPANTDLATAMQVLADKRPCHITNVTATN